MRKRDTSEINCRLYSDCLYDQLYLLNVQVTLSNPQF